MRPRHAIHDVLLLQRTNRYLSIGVTVLTSKTSTGSSSSISSLRQTKVKPRPAIRGRLCPHPSAMPRNDALDDRQSNPCPGELIHPVQALKYSEQLVAVAHVETCAVVAHTIDDVPALRGCGHIDHRSFTRTAVLDGIGEQIGPDLPQQHRIADCIG